MGDCSACEPKERQKAWFHVYLDNFFAGERTFLGEKEVAEVHEPAEAAWNAAGVVSSGKKRVHQLLKNWELTCLGLHNSWVLQVNGSSSWSSLLACCFL